MPTYNENLARLIDPSTEKVPYAKLATPIAQSDLTDLDVSGGTSGQTIKWDAGNSKWVSVDAPSIDTNSFATETYITTKITDLVNNAPAALDTLAEFATALDSNASIGTEMQSHINNGAMKAFIGDGSTDTFAFAHKTGNVDVWLNGVKLNPFVTNNVDQTYADAYINANPDTQAFSSGTDVPAMPVAESAVIKGTIKEDQSQQNTALWASNATANGVLGDFQYSIILQGDVASISSFDTTGYNGNPFMPQPDDYQLEFNDTAGSGGAAVGNYTLPIKILAAWYKSMNDETYLDFSIQDASYNAPGTTFHDNWPDMPPYVHEGSTFNLNFVPPGGGGFAPDGIIGGSATHVKTNIMPDNGDVVIVRAY